MPLPASAARRAAAAAVLVAGAVMVGGCIDALVLEFDGCTHEGTSLDVGASLPAPSGCGTCTCGPDGMVSCEERTCCVAPDGTTLQPGEGWSDMCSDCVCGEDGTVSCAAPSPCACAPSTGGCPEMPGCTVTEYCDEELGTWSCGYECVDPCANAEVPMCKTPLGCSPSFYCDETSGTYVCSPTCVCVEEPGECPATPGCTSTLYCDETSGAWTCVDDCPCGTDMPNCGYFASPLCDGETWTCGTMGSFCGDTLAPCPPAENPSCSNFPVCDVSAQGWVCVEECPIEYCPEESPTCPADPPGCVYFPLCQETGWDCVLHCQ